MSKTPELAMSAQNLDSTTEDIRESGCSTPTHNSSFQTVEKYLSFVKGLQEAKMFGAAINFLKKSLINLDEYLTKHKNAEIKEAHRLLLKVNVQLASCYFHVNETVLSVTYTRKALDLGSKDIKTLFFLGSNLLRCKEYLEGANVLSEAKDFAIKNENEEYVEIIERELKRYQKRIQRSQPKPEGTPEPVEISKEDKIIKEIEDLKRTKAAKTEQVEPIRRNNNANSSSFNVGNLYCFAGTVLSSSLGSWLLMRNSGNVSEKRSIVYSIGIGAVLGGICAFALGRNSSNTESK